MKEMFISVTGFNHYFGLTPFKPGQIFYCKKDVDNLYDSEAIAVMLYGLGKVGYVANSVHTVARGTMSAGRIYDRVESSFTAECMFIAGSYVICRVVQNTPDNILDENISFHLNGFKL